MPVRILPIRFLIIAPGFIDSNGATSILTRGADELAGPGAAAGTPGKAKSGLRKAPDYGIGTARFAKQGEHQLNSPTNFIISIGDDAALVIVAKAHGQREPQFTLACLVQLAALEAPAQEMQLGLRHRALEPQEQPIVEVASVVHAIHIDDHRVAQCAQFEQAVPVQIRARQARHLWCKHRACLAHRHIRYQGLEVLAPARLGTRLAQIPVQHAHRSLRPAQCQGLVPQGVLAFGALLVVPYLRQGRLPVIPISELPP